MKLHRLSIPVRAINQLNLGLFFALGSAGVISATQGFGNSSIVFIVLLIFGMFAVVFVAGIIKETLYYRQFEYDLTEDTFEIASGIVSWRERTIPLRRIQNIDITQDVLARAAGLAAVSLETAGGGNSTEGELRYVTDDEAERLQNEIQRLKRSRTDTKERPHELNVASENEDTL